MWNCCGDCQKTPNLHFVVGDISLVLMVWVGVGLQASRISDDPWVKGTGTGA